MYHLLITLDPSIMMGKPVIARTRITVEHILEELAHGATTEDLLSAHPRLTREAIQAALAYALRVLCEGMGGIIHLTLCEAQAFPGSLSALMLGPAV